MLVTSAQAAERLNLHPATIRRWLQAGRIRHVRVGHVRGIPPDEMRRLLRERKRPTKEEVR